MNIMNKFFFMMVGLLVMNSTAFAAMTLHLNNESSTSLSVQFAQPLENGNTTLEVGAGSKPSVVVSQAWLNADVSVKWMKGAEVVDEDIVHFRNALEELTSSSDDDQQDGQADVLSH